MLTGASHWHSASPGNKAAPIARRNADRGIATPPNNTSMKVYHPPYSLAGVLTHLGTVDPSGSPLGRMPPRKNWTTSHRNQWTTCAGIGIVAQRMGVGDSIVFVFFTGLAVIRDGARTSVSRDPWLSSDWTLRLQSISASSLW